MLFYHIYHSHGKEIFSFSEIHHEDLFHNEIALLPPRYARASAHRNDKKKSSLRGTK
jgi:hypothetical protein